MFHEPGAEEAVYTDTLVLDLGGRRAEPRRAAAPAGPRAADARPRSPSCASSRPWSRPAPPRLPANGDVERFAGEGGHTAVGVEQQSATAVEVTTQGERCLLDHGSVVIAAITSCTNTSNPAVMMAAGLLAKQGPRAGPALASRG